MLNFPSAASCLSLCPPLIPCVFIDVRVGDALNHLCTFALSCVIELGSFQLWISAER